MEIKKIAVRGGHTELCTGANALINELTEDRKVKDVVIKYLKSLGYDVLDVTPPINYTSSEATDLAYGVNKANEWCADLFVSIHFNNAYTSYNGAIGSEVCVYSKFDIAQRVVDSLGNLGFKNRGQKINTELYELRNTNMKSIIVETCFVEATEDVELYKKLGADAIGKSIAEAITNINVDVEAPSENVITDYKSEKVRRSAEFVGSRCKELQEKLIKLDYNCGGYGADGIFGEGTYDSLIAFQNKYCSMKDGLAGEETFRKLDELINGNSNGNDWIRRLQSECNNQGFSNQSIDGWAGTNTLNGCPMLRKGATGNITKLLQERLNNLGYYTNGVDGMFGEGTKNAVVKFQSDNGLGADGIVGRNTWNKLIYM